MKRSGKIILLLILAQSLIFCSMVFSDTWESSQKIIDYEILDWRAFYYGETGPQCAFITVKCNKFSDLLDNRNFVAVLANGVRVKGLSGDFNNLRTHAGEIHKGQVCFGYQDVPIDSLYFTSSLYNVE